MSTTVNYAPSWGPDVTLTVDDDLNIEAIIELDELEPTRDTTAEERIAGISSLDPPTVSIQAKRSRYDTVRAVIDGAWLAVAASVEATDGYAAAGPGALLMLNLRVTMAVREALRRAGEDV